jgi:hypothetical protein
MPVKSLYDPPTVQELRNRIERLRPDSPSAWGKMNVAQMLAHCSAWTEMAAGVNSPPRVFLGRIFGRWAKASVLGDEPIRRNMPTEKSLIVNDDRRFADEKLRLLSWTDRFAAAGPERCTKHPHCFFGSMTPDEWAIMGYKHLDHHLRQFGA